MAGLPRFLYVNERLAFSLAVASASSSPVACRVLWRPPQGPARSVELGLSPGETRTVVCELAVSDTAERRGCLECRAGAELLWARSFLLRDGREDLRGIRVRGNALRAEGGEHVVLLNERERESDYQRWLLVRWAQGTLAWQRATRVCIAPTRCFCDGGAAELQRRLSALLPGRAVTVADYAGDPVEALLSIDGRVPRDGPAILCLGWGFQEALGRFPVRAFTRALDLAVDRARRRNDRLQVVLLTPPPVVGEEAPSARLADAVRAVARRHHTGLIDLYARVTGREDWEAGYRLEQDPAILGLYPSRPMQGRLVRALAGGLR